MFLGNLRANDLFHFMYFWMNAWTDGRTDRQTHRTTPFHSFTPIEVFIIMLPVLMLSLRACVKVRKPDVDVDVDADADAIDDDLLCWQISI